ncbi:MAG: SIS domain-containing protein, partial [Acidibacillus sp.]|nr:SIS domain-containing protein [Acidibacillus sp.]
MSIVNTILDEIALVLERVEEDSIEKFAQGLTTAGRVFVIGEGRSGLMGKSFAMRLMHLGVNIFVIGETITPAVGSGDMLVAVSGSGK